MSNAREHFKQVNHYIEMTTCIIQIRRYSSFCAFMPFLAASVKIGQSDYHRVGRCQVDGSKRQWVNQLIVELESRVHPLFHSSLFVPNFMTKFGSEDLQSQGRVRPPHLKQYFCTHAVMVIPTSTAGLLVLTWSESEFQGRGVRGGGGGFGGGGRKCPVHCVIDQILGKWLTQSLLLYYTDGL